MKHRKLVLTFLAAILAFACNLPTPTPATSITETPTFTLIPLPTATGTAAGSTVPFASPNDGALNCRTGPDTTFAVAAVLAAGQSAEIAGKNPAGTWWYVKNPSVPGSFCWISAAFATVTGDVSGVAVVAVPATPTNKPGSAAGVVIAVDVSVDPDEIHVGGCIGPIQPVKVYASIRTDGAIKMTAHLKDEQSGNISTHELNFKKADFQDFSDSFTPLVNEGKHKITLVIDGLNLSGLDAVATYEITC